VPRVRDAWHHDCVTDRFDLTLLIPAYNEAKRLDDGVARLRATADEGHVDLGATEIIFIDDGSTDGTGDVARAIAGDLPHAAVITQPTNQGKGAAIRSGIFAAHGRKVVFMDADLAIDPSHLPELVGALDRSPIAVGSRADGRHIDYGSRIRTDAGRTFNALVHLTAGISLTDTQCGFKGFRRGPALLLAHLQTTSGYAFDVELLWLAHRLSLGIEEVPVTWVDVAGSTVSVARDSVRMLVDLVRASRRRRWMVLCDVTDSVPDDLPDATVVLTHAGGTTLCGPVSGLGAMRRAVGLSGSFHIGDLSDLASLAPFDVTPTV